MRIVVVGGAGLIGAKLVQALTHRGRDVLAADRSTGVDVLTGSGLREALVGADVVIDATNSPSFEGEPAMHFFRTAGRNLMAAESAAGVKLHVALSVVGTDRLQGSGYFRGKLAQQEMIETSLIPYTIVHATQFFEFLRTIADVSTRGAEVWLPPVLFQPMAADDVVSALAEAALSEPVNDIVEVSGPDQFTLDEAVAKVLAFDGDPRTVIPDPDTPYFGVRVGETSLIPQGRARRGPTHLDWWLRHTPSPIR